LCQPKFLRIAGHEFLVTKNRSKKQMTAKTPNTKTASALERQTGGTHYKNMAIQPAEYAEKNGLSLLEGNIVKYISRWKKKGQPLIDLEKIKHCVDLIIQIHDVK
tara:strand:+ start:325 stop:639 length:315 start_codon:yes stop_codon:yes gene_type:complete